MDVHVPVGDAVQRDVGAQELGLVVRNARRNALANLEALEVLHPVCLRWYTEQARTLESARWWFQCPDESDPPETPDDGLDISPLNPLSPLNLF